MKAKEFDIIGVREEGKITGYALRDELRDALKDKSVGDCLMKIENAPSIGDSDSLLTALETLRNEKWAIVTFIGTPCAIITRGDLQKTSMRIWLFGVISIFEMQLLRCIRAVYPEDEWIDLLEKKRKKGVNKILELRREKQEHVDVAECLQLCDKRDIIAQNQSLLDLVGFGSNADLWCEFMDEVENQIRNLVAHSSSIDSRSWPLISEIMDKVEACLVKLEGHVFTSPSKSL